MAAHRIAVPLFLFGISAAYLSQPWSRQSVRRQYHSETIPANLAQPTRRVGELPQPCLSIL